MRPSVARSLFLSLFGTACVPDIDDDLSIIKAPRLVAIRSVPAEVIEGQKVRFEALVAQPLDAPDSFPAFQLCVDRKPLTELGPVSPACLVPGGSSGDAVVSLGSGLEVEGTVSREACRLFGPRRPEPKPNEPAGRPVDPDDTGGFYQPVVAWLEPERLVAGAVRLNCGLGGATREALLEYAARYRRNENPDLAELEIVRSDQSVASVSGPAGTEPVTVAPGETFTLRSSWAACPRSSECGDGVCGAREDVATCEVDCTTPKGCSGAESYAFYDLESRGVIDRRESLLLSYYATAGHFSSERSGLGEDDPDSLDASVEFTAPRSATDVVVWVVIRDDRGGTGYVSTRLRVTAP